MDDNIKQLRAGSKSVVEYAQDPIVARVRSVADEGLLLESESGDLTVARMTTEVARTPPEQLAGSEVLVIFEGGNPEFPIALAVLHSTDNAGMHAIVDDEEVILNANSKIELRCGKGSITITRDGKIILRGTNLLSRSSGPLRIKGGHVDIN